MVVALYHLTAAFAQDPMLYEDTNGVLHCVTHGGGWGDPLYVSSTTVSSTTIVGSESVSVILTHELLSHIPSGSSTT
jgi:hypothetical protein